MPADTAEPGTVVGVVDGGMVGVVTGSGAVVTGVCTGG